MLRSKSVIDVSPTLDAAIAAAVVASYEPAKALDLGLLVSYTPLARDFHDVYTQLTLDMGSSRVLPIELTGNHVVNPHRIRSFVPDSNRRPTAYKADALPLSQRSQ